jgi:hypothetical protein
MAEFALYGNYDYVEADQLRSAIFVLQDADHDVGIAGLNVPASEAANADELQWFASGPLFFCKVPLSGSASVNRTLLIQGLVARALKCLSDMRSCQLCG